MIFNVGQEVHMMDWLYALFGPAWGIFMALGWVLYFAVGILLAYYTHRDALRRGIRNVEIWLLIVLIFNILGVVIYLLVRRNYEENLQGSSIKEHVK